MKHILGILLIFSIIFISCSDNSTIASNSDNLIAVQFDLKRGFENVTVSIRENDIYYFNAFLWAGEPLAGPQASFLTYLSKGSHNIITKRTPPNYQIKFKSDTTNIIVGNSKKYWIGMSVYSDSLYIVVQDSSFIYI